MAKTFEMWVTVLDWHDGDSARAVLDLGMHCYLGSVAHPVMFRAALINAPELSTGQPGLDAKMYAGKLAPPGEYRCVSYRPDEYGRPLIDVILPSGFMFSEAMLTAGQAVPYKR